MEGGGVREPEATGKVAAAQWYVGQIEEAVGDPLDDLAEETLLALIGAYSLTPIEQRNVALIQYGSEDLTALLRKEGFDLDTPMNLVRRGKETVERVLAEWGDELREKVCPLKARRGARRAELLAAVGSALAALLSLGAGVAALIAFYIVKFSLDELCEGWPAPVAVSP